MRFVRPVSAMLLAVGVATCSDTPIASVKSSNAPALTTRPGHVALLPVFSRSAQFVAEHADQFGVTYDSVRIIIRGLPDTLTIVKDTTIFFTPNSPDIVLDLDVKVRSDGQRFDAGMAFTFGGVVQYFGHGEVQSHAPNQPAPPEPKITINYTGPGSKIARLAVAPKTIGLLGAQSSQLSVTAFDSSGASVNAPPILWSTSNATIATVSSTGLVQGLNRRGTATITAQSPTGISDNASLNVTLPPASIALVSGGGQSGKAGSSLANPGIVQVSASDGVGVANVSVVFSAPTGGSVGTATATTDGNGRAQTTMRLGGTAGPQSFAATAGAFSVAIPATATPSDPAAIAIVAGNNQSDSIRKTLAPLSVRVTDQFNNTVSGVTVSWARTSGGGAVGSATSATNADGIATNTYTLGGTTGAETVSASIAGTSVTFSFTTTAGGAATIAAISGSGQSGRVNVPLANPFVVRVNDAGGNPVTGAAVTWTATNGTIQSTSTTDATGQTSATLTPGTTLGNASATARISNGQSVAFSATVAAGFASQMVFTAQPSNGTAGSPLSPAITVALRDAGGNGTNAANAVSIALGANTSGAVLSGTLTRNAVNGVATFNDLQLDRAGTGFTLIATSGSLPSITSSAFNITAGAAGLPIDNLQLAGLPTSKANNATFTPTVQLRSGTTNVPLSGVTVAVTIVNPSTGPNASLPTLVQGTSTTITATTDANGLATFTNIRAVGPIGSFALHFATTSLTSNVGVTTSDIALFAGAGYGIVLHSGDGQIGLISAALPTGLRVQLVDTSGNPATAPSATVNFSVLTGGGSVSTSAGTDVNGQATATWTLGAAEGSNTMRASTTIGSHTSNVDFSATGSDVHGMQFVATPPSSITTGVVFTPQPIIQLTDGNSHALKKSGVAVTAGVIQAFLQDVIAPHLNGTLTVNTDANGQAVFTNLQDASQTQTVKLTFASTGLTTLQTGAITLSPGSASQLIQYSGTTLAQIVGGTFTFFPTIKVGDVAGNGVSGKSVSFSATNNCTVTGTAITSDAGGFAALDNTTLTVNMNAPGSCRITASSPGLLSKDFYMIVKPSGANVWVGGTDNSFENYMNWTAGAVPISTDAVFIPTYTANSPVMGSSESVATLSMESGSALSISGANVLSVNNSVDATGAGITGKVNLLGGFSASGNFVRGSFSGLVFGDGTSSCTYGLNGNIATTSDVSIANCNVNNLGKFFQIGGNLSITGANGALEMTNSGDHVIVSGNATFDGSTTLGNMTEGVLDIKGNLTQGNTQGSNRSFAPTANHTTRLIGTGQQTVTFASPGASNSFFNNLDVLNTSVSGIDFNSSAQFNGQLDAEGSSRLSFGGSAFTFTFGSSALFRIHANALINANGTITPSTLACQQNGPTNPPTIGGFSGVSVALLQACTQASLP